ncbi:MAG: hypothetical protein HKP01_06680 [Gemmatimonadetes bacterium]|nr:hypothetical protein [Gemmatimonadota bacterium]
MLELDRMTLRGASRAEYELNVSDWRASQDDVPAVYVLLNRTAADQDPVVAHIAGTEHLEDSLGEHRDHPCMSDFVDSLAWIEVASGDERAEIARDLSALHKPLCEGCWPPIPVRDAQAEYHLHGVIGGCVAAHVTMDLRLEEAICEKRVVRFVHEKRPVEAEPREYGVSADGTPMLFAYRTGYGADGGGLPAWKAYPLAEIDGLVITDRPFGGARPVPPSPLAVAFVRERSPSPETVDAADRSETVNLLSPLRRNLQDMVWKLRRQVLEARRLASRTERIMFRLENLGGPAALSRLLASVEAARVQVVREILDLIPTVSALQNVATRDQEDAGLA